MNISSVSMNSFRARKVPKLPTQKEIAKSGYTPFDGLIPNITKTPKKAKPSVKDVDKFVKSDVNINTIAEAPKDIPFIGESTIV